MGTTNDAGDMPPEAKRHFQRLNRIFNIAGAVPEGDRIMTNIVNHKTPIFFTSFFELPKSLGEIRVFRDENDRTKLNPDDAVIAVRNALSDAKQAALMVHEGRHLEQAGAQVLNAPKRCSPEDYMWFQNMVEADAQATTAIVALKAKIAGDDSMFKSMAKRTGYANFPQMFRKAEELYKKDPTSIDTPEFKRQVFDTWFDNGSAVSRFLGLEDKNSYALKAIMDFPKWDKGCQKLNMPIEKLTAKDAEPIGVCGGEKVNYLTLPGFRPLDDPYYKKVNNIVLREIAKDQQSMWTWKNQPPKM